MPATLLRGCGNFLPLGSKPAAGQGLPAPGRDTEWGEFLIKVALRSGRG